MKDIYSVGGMTFPDLAWSMADMWPVRG